MLVWPMLHVEVNLRLYMVNIQVIFVGPMALDMHNFHQVVLQMNYNRHFLSTRRMCPGRRSIRS